MLDNSSLSCKLCLVRHDIKHEWLCIRRVTDYLTNLLDGYSAHHSKLVANSLDHCAATSKALRVSRQLDIAKRWQKHGDWTLLGMAQDRCRGALELGERHET